MSYQTAEWHWVGSKRRGAARFVLIRPRAAQLLPSLLRAEAAAAFEQLAADLVSAAQADPATSAQITRANPTAGLLMDDPVVRGGVKVFAEALSPEARATVLKGRMRPRLPLDGLGPATQAYVRSLYQGPNAPVKGLQPEPNPSWVGFYLLHFPSNLSPCLMVDVHGVGGFGCIGGAPLEKLHRKRQSDRWILSGERSGDPASEDRRVIAPRPPEKATDQHPPLGPLERRLRELSAGASISVLARLSNNSSVGPGSPNGLTVAEYLTKLTSVPPSLNYRWRKGVLLLSDPGWIDQEGAALVPYEVVKRLRQQDAENGVLSLAELSRADRDLSVPQLLSLRQEFGVLLQGARWRDLLAVYARSEAMAERLASRSGLSLLEVGPQVRSLSLPEFEPHFATQEGSALRLTEETLAEGKKRGREIRIDLLNVHGRRLAGKVLRYFGPDPAAR